MKKKIQECTIDDFRQLPYMEWKQPFDSLVILPTQARHGENGCRLMDYAIVVNQEPVCRVSGFSDVLHVDGIGSLGYNSMSALSFHTRPSDFKAWHIDCLPESGLLHIIAVGCKFTIGANMSSFELIAIPEASN